MAPSPTTARFRLDTANQRLCCGNRFVPLPAKPFSLLRLFVLHRPGALLSHEEIRRHLWPQTCVTVDSVKDYVHDLRQALGDDPKHPRYIQTVHGRGYRYLGGIEFDSGSAASPLRDPAVACIAIIAVHHTIVSSCSAPTGILLHHLHEDVQIALARFRTLSVVDHPGSHTRLRARRCASSPLAQARQFRLESRVRADTLRLRITARLLESHTGCQVWGEHYDSTVPALPGFPDAVVCAIASSVAQRLTLMHREHILRTPRELLTAADLVLEGESTVVHTKAGVLRARQAFAGALELDPGSARACAGMAHSHAMDAYLRFSATPGQSLNQALKLASRSVFLDAADCKPAWVLAQVLALYGRFDEAALQCHRACVLNPLDIDAICIDGMHRAAQGQPRSAMACFLLTMQICPYYSHWYLWLLGNIYRGRHRELSQRLFALYAELHTALLRSRPSVCASHSERASTQREESEEPARATPERGHILTGVARERLARRFNAL